MSIKFTKELRKLTKENKKMQETIKTLQQTKSSTKSFPKKAASVSIFT